MNAPHSTIGGFCFGSLLALPPVTVVFESGLSHFILIGCCCRSNIDRMFRLRIDQAVASEQRAVICFSIASMMVSRLPVSNWNLIIIQPGNILSA
jgi:hypothetical protein